MHHFDVRLEQDESTWVASCVQHPEWTGIADTREEIMKLAFEGMAFIMNDPTATIVVQYHEF